MFLLDNLLLAPGRAVIALFDELTKKAREEFLDDESVKKELQEIHALIEGGHISEREFESREEQLLERLEQIARAKLQEHWTAERTLPPADPIEAEIIPPPTRLFQPALAEAAPLAAEPGVAGQTFRSARTAMVAPTPIVEHSPIIEHSPIVAAMPPVERTPLVEHSPTAEYSPIVEQTASAEHPSIGECAPTVERAPTVELGPIVERAPFVEPIPTVEQAAENRPAADRSAPPAAAVSAVVPAASPGPLAMGHVVRLALEGLSVLKLRVSSVTSVMRADRGWRVSVEVVERRSVPDTGDLLALYELHLDEAGTILGYERTRMRRRSDLIG